MPTATVDDVALLELEKLLEDDHRTCEVLWAIGLCFKLSSRDIRFHTKGA